MYAHHQTMQQSVVEVKQRRGGPKVRTGCYTCKKRRVKCDETKPSCKRCVKAEVECDGYPPPSTRAPRSSAASQRAAILARTSPSIMSPTIILFNNDEHRYFRLYQDSAAYELSGYFESEFWTRVVLQESHIEDSVKATVIALGALTMGLAVPSGPSVDDRCGLGRIGMTTPHHQFAFRQYSRALKHLRARLASGRTGLRSALISCLLCVCFESVLGEHETAMIQVRQGLKLLNDSKFSSPASSPGASPSGDKIEDELRQMFARLEIQARSFKNSPDVPIQEDYPDPQYIPETFSDINAARIFNDRLTRRAILLSNEIEDYRYVDPATHPPHLLKQQTDLLTTLELAAMANNNLYQASIKTIGVIRGSAGPVVLRTHAIMDKILLATAFSPLETAYDAYVDDFKEVVACARAVHDARPAWHVFISKSYTFDGGLIPGLYITATKCRDSKTRWEAIAQLKGAKSREGSWDSDMAARAGEWIATIEEQGWVGAWNHTGSDTDGELSRSGSENGSENGSGTMVSVLPEEKRVRIIDMKMDLVNNKAFIKCGQRDIGDEDWRNIREANLSW